MITQKPSRKEETMFRIAVCDDTAEHADRLARAIKTIGEELSFDMEVDLYETYDALEKSELGAYHLLILETEVAGRDGVAFAVSLRTGGYTAEILFFTADRARALSAFAAYPIGFLVKPAGRQELRDVLRFLQRRCEKKPSLLLKGNDGRRNGFLPDDIICIEVFRTELQVHCTHGSVNCVGALADVYEKLPKKQFYRSHRSFIVNLERVARMEKYRFIMQDGTFVTIAKNRYAEAKTAWRDFCEEK